MVVLRFLTIVILALWLGDAGGAWGKDAPASRKREESAVEPSGTALQRFEGCRFVETEWADGDSFSVRLPDKREVTIRLYGADCVEVHVKGNESNAKRLLSQRKYFGIADINVAEKCGEAARDETRKLLAKPFTVETAFADGRGSPDFKRYYGFVILADGRDLSETLVSKGLARAYGVYRQRGDGTKAEEWKERVRDLELKAAAAHVGNWQLTDWELLPIERRQAREEEAEIEKAKMGPELPPDWKLDVNSASRDELCNLPGIGETFAMRIIEGRPYTKPEDLDKVPGIGEATIRKIKPHLKFGKSP